MKNPGTSRSGTRRPARAALACLAAVACVGPAASARAVEYDVTRIVPVPNAYSTVPVSMNDHGQVVGWSQFFDGSPSLQGWVWTPGAAIQYLPAPPGLNTWAASDINDAGVVCGDGGYDFGQAWRYDGSGYTMLGTLLVDNVSTASRINASGVVALTSRDGQSFLKPPHAVVAAPGQALQQVQDDAWATGLNDAGQVCGYSNLKAFRYTPGAGVTFLGPLGTKPLTYAWSINAHGDVVGDAASANGNGHVPFLYTDAAGMQEIGNFGGGAAATDINDAGVVVGNFSTSGNKPWIWTASDGVRFLGALIDPAEKLNLLSAVRINESGQILCRAADQVAGGYVAVVLTPKASDPWSDLGFSLAGTNGAPTLDGAGSLQGGQPMSLAIGNALPGATTLLMAGFQRVDAPFLGGTIVPAFTPPSGTLLFLTSGPSGSLTLNATWPSGLPSGATLYAQAWVVDPGGVFGVAATNAVAGALP